MTTVPPTTNLAGASVSRLNPDDVNSWERPRFQQFS